MHTNILCVYNCLSTWSNFYQGISRSGITVHRGGSLHVRITLRLPSALPDHDDTHVNTRQMCLRDRKMTMREDCVWVSLYVLQLGKWSGNLRRIWKRLFNFHVTLSKSKQRGGYSSTNFQRNKENLVTTCVRLCGKMLNKHPDSGTAIQAFPFSCLGDAQMLIHSARLGPS